MEYRLVPDLYATPQAAHDAASGGDVIVLRPGAHGELTMTKPVHVVGDTDDPCSQPVETGQIALEITNWQGINEVLIESVSPRIGTNNCFRTPATFSPSGRYVINRCNLTTASAGRILDGNLRAIWIRLLQCTRTSAGRVQQLLSVSEVEHFGCELVTEPVDEGWSLFYDDSVRVSTTGYGCGYGDMLREQYAGTPYRIAGTETLELGDALDDIQVMLFRESSRRGWVHPVPWRTTTPDPVTGRWQFDYLPQSSRYAVAINPPGCYGADFLRWYTPEQEG